MESFVQPEIGSGHKAIFQSYITIFVSALLVYGGEVGGRGRGRAALHLHVSHVPDSNSPSVCYLLRLTAIVLFLAASSEDLSPAPCLSDTLWAKWEAFLWPFSRSHWEKAIQKSQLRERKRIYDRALDKRLLFEPTMDNIFNSQLWRSRKEAGKRERERSSGEPPDLSPTW